MLCHGVLTGSNPVLTTKMDKMKGSMILKDRKNIVRKAKSLISKEIKDYNNKEVGEQESILDEYIEKVCIEKGWELSHFYFEEGNILNKLLK